MLDEEGLQETARGEDNDVCSAHRTNSEGRAVGVAGSSAVDDVRGGSLSLVGRARKSAG